MSVRSRIWRSVSPGSARISKHSIYIRHISFILRIVPSSLAANPAHERQRGLNRPQAEVSYENSADDVEPELADTLSTTFHLDALSPIFH